LARGFECAVGDEPHQGRERVYRDEDGRLRRLEDTLLRALILLCQFGEVGDEDGEQSAGEVALNAG